MKIPKDDLEIIKQIRPACNYVVYLGRWQHTDVSVRIFQHREAHLGQSPVLGNANMLSLSGPGDKMCAPGGQLACLLEEACHKTPTFMQNQVQVMAATRHPNVVMLLGVCLEGPYLITELCSKGTLADLLSKARSQPSMPLHMKWIGRLKMAWEISKGVLHLHKRQPVIVHGNLRTANVLVNSSWHCKVSDFGCGLRDGNGSQGQEASDNLNGAAEVRHGAEALMKSDTFAFGLILMELLTLMPPEKAASLLQAIGQQGGGVDILMVTVAELIGEKVPYMREYLDLTVRCTATDPGSRPSFELIVAELRSLLYDTDKPPESRERRWSADSQSTCCSSYEGIGDGGSNRSSSSDVAPSRIRPQLNGDVVRTTPAALYGQGSGQAVGSSSSATKRCPWGTPGSEHGRIAPANVTSGGRHSNPAPTQGHMWVTNPPEGGCHCVPSPTQGHMWVTNPPEGGYRSIPAAMQGHMGSSYLADGGGGSGPASNQGHMGFTSLPEDGYRSVPAAVQGHMGSCSPVNGGYRSVLAAVEDHMGSYNLVKGAYYSNQAPEQAHTGFYMVAAGSGSDCRVPSVFSAAGGGDHLSLLPPKGGPVGFASGTKVVLRSISDPMQGHFRAYIGSTDAAPSPEDGPSKGLMNMPVAVRRWGSVPSQQVTNVLMGTNLLPPGLSSAACANHVSPVSSYGDVCQATRPCGQISNAFHPSTSMSGTSAPPWVVAQAGLEVSQLEESAQVLQGQLPASGQLQVSQLQVASSPQSQPCGGSWMGREVSPAVPRHAAERPPPGLPGPSALYRKTASWANLASTDTSSRSIGEVQWNSSGQNSSA
eukprot:jgi/Botrbrau1/16382/Bobra.85_2s0006.1